MFTAVDLPEPQPDPAADHLRALVDAIISNSGVRFLTPPDVRLRLDVTVSGVPIGAIDILLERWPLPSS